MHQKNKVLKSHSEYNNHVKPYTRKFGEIVNCDICQEIDHKVSKCPYNPEYIQTQNTNSKRRKSQNTQIYKRKVHVSATTKIPCFVCGGEHPSFDCPTFRLKHRFKKTVQSHETHY